MIHQPSQPGQPNQPGQPGQPGQPNQPNQPGQPGQPGSAGDAAHARKALDADQTAKLLEQLVYEQVLACVDLDALYSLEQSITLLAGDLDGVGPDRAAELAKAMLDRAMLRLPDDMRRYLRAVDWMSCDCCVLCDQEAREGRSSAGTGTRERRATRFRS